MENELKIRIAADISDLKKKLKDANVSMDMLTDAQKEAIQEVDQLARSNAQASRSYAGLSKSSGASLVVFQEFNRVIQDAPFGMIGVGNNLQQLAANFGNLATKQKGVGPAIKESFRAMTVGINPAIIAVSVITSAMTFYKMQAWKSKDETESFTEALEKFKKTLDSVASAQLQGASNAAKESRKFEELRAQAENANIPLEDRIEAVRELQKLYPDFLGNLSDEEIMTGKVGTAYDSLTKYIVANAKARAFSAKIGENSIKQLEIEERIAARKEELLKEENRLAAAAANRQRAGEGPQFAGGQTIAADVDKAKIQKQINNLKAEEKADEEEIEKIKAQNLELDRKINEQLVDGARFTEDLTNKTKDLGKAADDARKAYDKLWDEHNKKFFREGAEQYNAFNRELAEELAFQKRLEEGYSKILADFEKIDVVLKPPKAEKAEMYDPSEELEQIAMKARLTEAAFDGLGRAVSRAFGGGNEWGRFLSDFLKFAGEVIATNFAISKSNVIMGATASGAAAGPAAAFVTPALITKGLVMIGALFSAISSKSGSSSGFGMSSKSYGGLPGREKGGPVIAGRAYIVGEKRPEVFVPKTSGMIIPRISDMASSSVSTSGRVHSNVLKVEVYGEISNDSIRVSNKRGERRANKT